VGALLPLAGIGRAAADALVVPDVSRSRHGGAPVFRHGLAGVVGPDQGSRRPALFTSKERALAYRRGDLP